MVQSCASKFKCDLTSEGIRTKLFIVRPKSAVRGLDDRPIASIKRRLDRRDLPGPVQAVSQAPKMDLAMSRLGQ
jgi:hypothetical protein